MWRLRLWAAQRADPPGQAEEAATSYRSLRSGSLRLTFRLSACFWILSSRCHAAGKKENPQPPGHLLPQPTFPPTQWGSGWGADFPIPTSSMSAVQSKKEDEIGQLDVISKRFVVNPSLSLLFLFGTVDVPAEGDLHRGTFFLRGKSQCLA